jgi:hypothetical protein
MELSKGVSQKANQEQPRAGNNPSKSHGNSKQGQIGLQGLGKGGLDINEFMRKKEERDERERVKAENVESNHAKQIGQNERHIPEWTKGGETKLSGSPRVKKGDKTSSDTSDSDSNDDSGWSSDEDRDVTPQGPARGGDLLLRDTMADIRRSIKGKGRKGRRSRSKQPHPMIRKNPEKDGEAPTNTIARPFL